MYSDRQLFLLWLKAAWVITSRWCRALLESSIQLLKSIFVCALRLPIALASILPKLLSLIRENPSVRRDLFTSLISITCTFMLIYTTSAPRAMELLSTLFLLIIIGSVSSFNFIDTYYCYVFRQIIPTNEPPHPVINFPFPIALFCTFSPFSAYYYLHFLPIIALLVACLSKSFTEFLFGTACVSGIQVNERKLISFSFTALLMAFIHPWLVPLAFIVVIEDKKKLFLGSELCWVTSVILGYFLIDNYYQLAAYALMFVPIGFMLFTLSKRGYSYWRSVQLENLGKMSLHAQIKYADKIDAPLN